MKKRKFGGIGTYYEGPKTEEEEQAMLEQALKLSQLEGKSKKPRQEEKAEIKQEEKEKKTSRLPVFPERLKFFGDRVIPSELRVYYGFADLTILGIVYLMKKHPTQCVYLPVSNIEQSKSKLETQRGIYEVVVYQDNVVVFPPGLGRHLVACEKSKKQIASVLLSIVGGRSTDNAPPGHFNILIFDTKTKTVERFEPYGLNVSKLPEKMSQSMETALEEGLARRFGYTYISPVQFCPASGPQFIGEGRETDIRAGDIPMSGESFCGAWSLWWADLRLGFPRVDRKLLLEEAIAELSRYPKGKYDPVASAFRNFMVGYSNFFVKTAADLFKKIPAEKLSDPKFFQYATQIGAESQFRDILLKELPGWLKEIGT
jgi:hypothetical protein